MNYENYELTAEEVGADDVEFGKEDADDSIVADSNAYNGDEMTTGLVEFDITEALDRVKDTRARSG